MAPMAPSRAALARRTVTALAAAAVLGAAAAPAAFAEPAAPSASPKKLPDGLYGTASPEFDGVWRQSLALLAQHTVGVRPAASAVDWLAGQQCADGSFTAFRADPAKGCDGATQRDTNQTGAAVQALAALGGHGEAVTKAVHWLKSVQNDDGGWPSMAGSPSDANSTSVVIGALAAAGTKPESVVSKKGGKSPYDALLTFHLDCAAKPDERGAFAFQPKDGTLVPNADATAAAVLGAHGEGFVVDPPKAADNTPVKPLSCKDGKSTDDGKRGAEAARRAAEGGAAHLVAQLDAHDQHLLSAMPGAEDQPDVGNTADTVVALAAGGHRDAAAEPLAWLEKNAQDWARKSGPAGYAQLVFAAHATGTDPRAFGGTDLVAALNATGPKPAAQDAPGAKEKETEDDGGSGLVWFIGIGLAIGAGIGFLLSGRRRKGDL